MKKISILIALACAMIMSGCAGGVKTGKSDREGISGTRQSQKKSIAEQSVKTKAAMSAYPTKSTPVGADTFLISDSDAANATKKATLSSTKDALGLGATANPSFNSVHASGGNLAAANAQVTKKWITGLPYTANVTSVIYGGKHYICTSTHTADSTTEPGVGASWATVWGEVVGGSGTTYTAGTGIDITSGVISSTVTGTLPPGTVGQTIQYDENGQAIAVAPAPLSFTGSNLSYNETTGLVSIVTDSSPTNGSTNFLTSDAVYDALAGKENADSTIVKVSEIDTQAEFEALVGWTLPSGGTGGGLTSTLSAAPYSDVACTSDGVYNHTLYKCVDDGTGIGYFTEHVATTAYSNAQPITYAANLTITDDSATGDTFTLNSIAYDADDSPVSVTNLPTATEQITYTGSNTAACTGDVTGTGPWNINASPATVGCTITLQTATPYYSDNFNTYSNGVLPTTSWSSNTVRPLPNISDGSITAASSTSIAVYKSDMPTSNYMMCANVGSASISQGGPIVRASKTTYTQYDFMQQSPTNIRLRKVVVAANTTLQDIPVTMNDGDELCLRVSGESPVILTGYRNGVEVVSYSDSSTNKIGSGVSGGVAVYSGTVDNWRAYE